MNICHIATILFNIPHGRSGPERVFYNLNESLYKLNPELRVYACKNSIISGELKYYYPIELNNYAPFNNAIGSKRGKFIVNHLTNAFNQEKDWADVFQTHNVEFALPIGSLLNKKVVITLHNPITEELIEQIEKFNSPNIHFVTVSNTQKIPLSDKIQNVTTIYNGVELDLIPFQAEKEDFLLFVGRLDRKKGADIAMRVAINNGYKIVVVGKPSEGNKDSEKFFKEEVTPLLDNPLVEHHANIDHFELLNYYAKAKAVLFPILDGNKEPFGLVPVEAMASGTPVIALDNSLTRETIKNGFSGLLAMNEEEMSAKLSELNTIKPENCRAWVAENFTRDIMAANYLKLYSSLLS